ncbi:MAG: PsbP-related protein [Candidatus Micrarchaeota archaeon]|nr:PsbP-related protein [Candidatus Micrarchaeota archaeon]
MSKPLLFLVILSALLLGCTMPNNSFAGSGDASANGYANFENSFYSLNYPQDWSVADNGEVVSFSSPQSENDAFVENVNILVTPATENVSLQEYFENSVDSLFSSLEGFNLIGFNETHLSGVNAYTVEYTAKNFGNNLSYVQVFTMKNNAIYIIAYSGSGSDYSRYLPLVNQLMDSFTIKDGIQDVGGQLESADAQASADFNKNWAAYSKSLYYDNGEFSFLETPSDILELNPDRTWTFGAKSGTWTLVEITPADWAKWGINEYGPTNKLVLYGWDSDVVDGPIEESRGVPEFLWVIYRQGAPEFNSPGQIQMKFGWSGR